MLHDIAALKHAGKKPTPISVFVFANRRGQPYTAPGFQCMWAKVMTDWLSEGETRERFTFPDLRANDMTHIMEGKKDPETHSNPATTRRVYDRRRVRKNIAFEVVHVTKFGTCHHLMVS
ncbi:MULTISPECIES: hypothetical protein [Alcaligenaceae]|uniref:hypothetical protein n=1 Tax=Alcaligenaceae TaxID=506 RepID=UPI0010578F9D|nr:MULTISPECIES: hypothetical protein [Alcaligenaceae]NYT69305.1 hypothetical protein [Pusillimonas noertemannii]TFL09707.1 hypothetical protein CSC72_12600 [Pusillimonas noertemannii]WJJ94075.1 hypothetical protein N7E01_02580 [Neopusillimonas aromaticivorans]